MEAQRIPNYARNENYHVGAVALGTDGRLWQQSIVLGEGGHAVPYWQPLPVLNVETMELEPQEAEA